MFTQDVPLYTQTERAQLLARLQQAKERETAHPAVAPAPVTPPEPPAEVKASEIPEAGSEVEQCACGATERGFKNRHGFLIHVSRCKAAKRASKRRGVTDNGSADLSRASGSPA